MLSKTFIVFLTQRDIWKITILLKCPTFFPAVSLNSIIFIDQKIGVQKVLRVLEQYKTQSEFISMKQIVLIAELEVLMTMSIKFLYF